MLTMITLKAAKKDAELTNGRTFIDGYEVKWIAFKAGNTWIVKTGPPAWTHKQVKENGTILQDERRVQAIVQCSKQVLNFYKGAL